MESMRVRCLDGYYRKEQGHIFNSMLHIPLYFYFIFNLSLDEKQRRTLHHKLIL
jgi:hypothetical protein